MKNNKHISRRSFLKVLGAGAAATLAACAGKKENAVADDYKNQVEPPVGKMTYRTNPTTGDQVSLLGYGMMRLPMIEGKEEFDQDMINRQIDYAIEHGVNYFDTSPVYCRGLSERCTGIALARHKEKRKDFFVATKLSNFGPDFQTTEGAKKMYHDSMRELQVDYIDYYLLHAIGGSMEEFYKRYVNNGIMDFLVAEREAGRIRNLGFSFHGRQDVFDEVIAMHDKYHWDTQATLSRDLKSLKVSKGHHPSGGYFYTVSEGENRRGTTDNFIGDISRGFVGMNFSGNLGVIRTLPGYANTVAVAFDSLGLDEILGTVAGDDTVIFVIKEGITKEKLKDVLRKKFPSLYI